MKVMSKNLDRNTTIAGILQFVAVVSREAQSLFDGDALTAPDWELLVLSIIALYGLINVKNKVVDTK